MAKGVRMRLLAQSAAIWTPVDPVAFVEHGSTSEAAPERMPYDASVLKSLAASGRLG